MDLFGKVFRGDRGIWIIFFFLCAISIVEVFSASSTLTHNTNIWSPIVRHTVFLVLGGFLTLGVHALKPKLFGLIGILLPIVWLLLFATPFLGESVNGSHRWISMGPLSFQPSELAKLSLITLTAFLLSKKVDSGDKRSFLWISITAGFTCLLIFRENGSTALMLFGIIFLMMIIGQISFKYLSYLIGILLVFGALMLAFSFIAPETFNKTFHRFSTWTNRVEKFQIEKDPHSADFKIVDENYQESHAKIAISNGGFFRFGPGKSVERNFLPQAYSDFIYAIIIEEFGLFGGLFVMALYIWLMVRAGIIAQRCKKLFPKLLVLGCALLIVTQAFANMAVAVGLIPVTGQPLPLISRGGTSTLITCIYFGIILSVSRYENDRGLAREQAIEEEFQQMENEKLFTEEELETI